MKTKMRHRSCDPPASPIHNYGNNSSSGYDCAPCPSEKRKREKGSFLFGGRTFSGLRRLVLLVVICFIAVKGLCFVSNSSFSGTPSLRSFALRTFVEYDDLPPADLVVHGSRDFYTPCPPEYRKHAFLGLDDSHVTRAFRHEGYTISHDEEDATAGKHHILYRHRNIREGFSQGKPWQRFSRIPGGRYWDPKDLFHAGFRKFQQKHEEEVIHGNNSDDKNKKDLIYFLPETYELEEEQDQKKFLSILNDDKETGNHRPWVLKKVTQNNGRGIEMLAPDSKALYSSVARSVEDKENRYVVQSYICNELTWFRGEKFDLRFYWLIASVDPLIVMYHDGYARVAGALYDESDFGSTAQHLTNHEFRGEVDQDVLADALWRRVTEHYEANKRRLSKLVIGGDPVRHVRNQMKEAISATAAAFKDALTLRGPKNKTVTTENLFGFYGADFIIDEDLDVYYVEAQVSTGLGDGYDYRVELFRDLFRPMINIVEEIAMKQEQDAKGNILPIESAKGWDLVYAGDEWRYQYKGYERSKNKRGCNLKPSQMKKSIE